ncbi:MAG: PadR family transcriptional regulator [Acidobacteria bacterium]|jgi:DNA-binding PadR family transcriptional regulator|nr:PadR family transcriptional regulator [Acidobacteriota bacterium]
MSLEHILLGLLREPASGYDLKKLFEERLSHIWRAELSQIYPTLKRLERRGLVDSREAAARRGSGRRLYALTKAGRQELHVWLSGPPQFADERMAWVAQLYFMGELEDLDQTMRFLGSVRAHFAAKLAALSAIQRMWTAADPRYPRDLPVEDLHVHFALRKGMCSLAAHIEWCDESVAELTARLEARSSGTSREPGAAEEAP